MFIYNFSLILIFATLFQFISSNTTVISSFSDLKLNFFFSSVLTITFFSLAGVPPLLGFFPKLLILVSLINSNFFIFFIFFFSLLFLALYFYVQNVRFLQSTHHSTINYSFDFSMRNPSLYYLLTIFFLFFLIFGLVFNDDIVLYFYWLIY